MATTSIGGVSTLILGGEPVFQKSRNSIPPVDPGIVLRAALPPFVSTRKSSSTFSIINFLTRPSMMNDAIPKIEDIFSSRHLLSKVLSQNNGTSLGELLLQICENSASITDLPRIFETVLEKSQGFDRIPSPLLRKIFDKAYEKDLAPIIQILLDRSRCEDLESVFNFAIDREQTLVVNDIISREYLKYFSPACCKWALNLAVKKRNLSVVQELIRTGKMKEIPKDDLWSAFSEALDMGNKCKKMTPECIASLSIAGAIAETGLLRKRAP